MNNLRWISAVAIATAPVMAWFWSSSHEPASNPQKKSPTAPAGNPGVQLAAPDGAVSLDRQVTGNFLARLRAEADPIKREAAAQQAARGLPRALFGEILANLQEENDRALADEAARAILLRWAWEEPTGAAAWALQARQGELRRLALAAVGAGWARENPDALMAWSASLAPGERDWVLLHGASYFARTDLEMFAIWQQALPASREREQLVAQAAREWAGRDARAVAQALGKFSGPEYVILRGHMAAGLANQLSQIDSFGTVRAVLDAVPPGEEQRQVLGGVVAGWARRDPVVVAAWVDGVADSSLRREMSALLAGPWFERDVAAAEKWAAGLPAGPIADAVAERAAQYFATRDRTSAKRWAERITSPEVRSRTLEYVQATGVSQYAP